MIHHRSNERRVALLGFAAAAAVLLFAPSVNGQVLAGLEIISTEGIDPHPAVYTWDGDREIIREPEEFYTFFYTGTVSSDATVPVDTPVGRIAIPNTQWDQNRATMIANLTAYYAEAYQVVANQPRQNTVTLDENFEYVEVDAPGQQANAASIDPKAAAEWTFYLDQVVLWQFHTRRVLLNDPKATMANSGDDELARAAARQTLIGFEGVDIDTVIEEAERLQREGLDDEFGVEETFSSGGSEFDPDAIYADPAVMDKYRDEFMRMARSREKIAFGIYLDMLNGVESRRSELDRYEAWLDQKQSNLLDFARAWGKVQAGQRVSFGETFYLVTKEPMSSVPRGARNVVVREVMTPQDLIEMDGRLKGPIFGEDLSGGQ